MARAKLDIFKYQAVTPEGVEYAATIEALSLPEARSELDARGVTVVNLTRQPLWERSLGGNRKPSADDMALVSTMYGVMLTSPMSHPEVLENVARAAKNPRIKGATLSMRSARVAGTSIPDAMATYPDIYDGSFRALTKAALNTSNEDQRRLIFDRLAEMYNTIADLNAAIRNALIQPGLTLIVMALVVGGLMLFVIPEFQNIFESMEIELPLATRALIATSAFMASPWMLMLVVVLAVPGYFLGRWARTEDGRRFMDRVLLRLPLIGTIVQLAALGKAVRTLGVLLAAGGTAQEDALRMAGDAAGNAVIKEAFYDAATARTLGVPMHVSFQRHAAVLTEQVAGMTRVGEASKSAPKMLLQIATLMEKEVGHRAQRLSRVIEPLSFVVLGSVVLGIMLAIMLPMTSLMNSVGGA